LRGNWQDFNWHDASRGLSAIAELLGTLTAQAWQALILVFLYKDVNYVKDVRVNCKPVTDKFGLWPWSNVSAYAGDCKRPQPTQSVKDTHTFIINVTPCDISIDRVDQLTPKHREKKTLIITALLRRSIYWLFASWLNANDNQQPVNTSTTPDSVE